MLAVVFQNKNQDEMMLFEGDERDFEDFQMMVRRQPWELAGTSSGSGQDFLAVGGCTVMSRSDVSCDEP